MTQLNTELLSALANKQDITEVFRLELETTINHLLTTELTAFLDYEPYNRPADARNYRNGYSKREIDTAYGRITVQMPRDRVGAFNTPTLAPYQRHTAIWEELMIDVKARGVEQILLFVADGVVGLQSTIAKHFPRAQFQRCLVHVARNFTAKIRVTERKAINDEFRAIRQSPTREEAESAMAI